MTESGVIERTVPLPEISGGRITSQRFARSGEQWMLIVRDEWLDHASDPPKKRHKFYVIAPEADYTYICKESIREPST